MGASPLFPLFVALFFLAVAAVSKNYLALSQTMSSTTAITRLQAGAFLHYREAVTAYTLATPGFTGTVPASYLSGQGLAGTVQTEVSHRVLASPAGRQVLVFAAMPDKGFEAFRLAENDAAIGTVAGGLFQPFVQGVTTGLPVVIPDGYVVSFVEVGN